MLQYIRPSWPLVRYLWAADNLWDTCEQLTACEILVSSWQLLRHLWAADSLWDTCEQLNPLSLSPRKHVTIEAATKFLTSSKRCHHRTDHKMRNTKWIKLYIYVKKNLFRAFRGAAFPFSPCEIVLCNHLAGCRDSNPWRCACENE